MVDKNGRFVTNLPQEAFTVLENGVEQQIKTFRREDVPVSMGLVVDNSGSMRDKRAKVEAAALALVKDSNPEDEMFVVNFNDEAFLDLPHGKDFTNNVKEMEEALTRIDARGGTAMRDALRMSIDHVKGKARKEKKVLVAITDGNDNSSIVTLEVLTRASQQSEVLVYASAFWAKRSAARRNALGERWKRWPKLLVARRSSRRTFQRWTASRIRWLGIFETNTRSYTRPLMRRWTIRSAKSRSLSKRRETRPYALAAAIMLPPTKPPLPRTADSRNNAILPASPYAVEGAWSASVVLWRRVDSFPDPYWLAASRFETRPR